MIVLTSISFAYLISQ